MILHRDDELVAVHKPPGLLTHPTRWAERGLPTCAGWLRRELGVRVHPVNRLDRAAGGIVIFARTPEGVEALARQYREKSVVKRYAAVVRGFLPERGVIDHPLPDDRGHGSFAAVTEYERAASVELPEAVGRYATARFSLAVLSTRTGRHHQIRHHLSHANHPILGDTTWGDGRQNRFFRERFPPARLWLEAFEVRPRRPADGREWVLRAPWTADWRALAGRLGWTAALGRC